MNEKKTAEDLKLYGISYTWKHSDGREERIPPMEIMVKKINEAQETSALREENERLKEALKELLIIAGLYSSMPMHNNISRNATNNIIENAKKLTWQI